MENKKVVFGPVLSRRLGYSLGIDILPSKTCNLDCVYCEVCKTTNLTDERFRFVDFDQVINEISEVSHEIDYITITGSGEPTLHLDLNILIAKLKKNFNYPIVLITNSLLLRKKSVRKELENLDIIMPSLDAVSQDVFEAVNKPVKGIMITDVINGLIDFRKTYRGNIWLEILFCKGINDGINEIKKMKGIIKKINPDKIQLNTVARPPAYTNTGPLSFSELQTIADLLDNQKVEIIISKPSNRKGEPLTEIELINYLRRRPANFEEINLCFGEQTDITRTMLLDLQKSKKIEKYTYNNEVFFKVCVFD
ncbi:MAG: hypothetical protein A2Y40_03460 [Candidatus Margulisbacteria bacterium GWF2_35_9]|nr:MAG: hypothetical protein A2Y40_03460 [Candidatus Margulisbacteria bacterium GWF2_35_9]